MAQVNVQLKTAKARKKTPEQLERNIRKQITRQIEVTFPPTSGGVRMSRRRPFDEIPEPNDPRVNPLVLREGLVQDVVRQVRNTYRGYDRRDERERNRRPLSKRHMSSTGKRRK